MRQIPQTHASVHILTNHTVVLLISSSDFNTIILFSCSFWLFKGNISPFLIKPSLITPSWPSLPCFQPPFSCGPIMKLISDEETFWSVSFSSHSIIPSSKWWKVGLQCRRGRHHSPKPPPSFFPLCTDLLFEQNRDAKWLSGASAAWNSFAVQQQSVACVLSGHRLARRCFHTDCLQGIEPNTLLVLSGEEFTHNDERPVSVSSAWPLSDQNL